jgi:hypothetical protein
MAEALPHSLELWDNAARLALPLWLKAWLVLLALTFAASLLFVRRHAAARWALLGFAVSHLIVVVLQAGGLATMRTGLVSLSHVIGWSPVLVILARALPASPARSAYRVWCGMLLGIIGISLIFDVRDASMYLYHLATGHPVFAPPAG